MSHNYYSEIHLHIVWHTKQSAPLLTPAVESLTHHELRRKIIDSPGAFVHEIGGTPTHVHLALSVVPLITISDFIGQLKGSSSHQVNQRLGRKALHWQTGYGVVSFAAKDLPWIVDYIRNQKEHHAQGTTRERLERMCPDDGAAIGAQAQPQREAP